MYYIYILWLKNNNLYTSNLNQRYRQHKNGEVESTKYLAPVKLVHYECYLHEEDARRRERFLKTSDGKLFLRRQLSVFFKSIGKYEDYEKAMI